jgi:hypothetical protein
MSEGAAYGIMGEFTSPEPVMAAARRLRLNGFRRMEAYTPFPVEGLDEVLRSRRVPWLPLIVFAAAVAGAVAGYGLQYYAAAIDYPINVGGRPLNSWPAFGVSAFEIMLLSGLSAAFFAFLLFCGLPQLCHPVFDAPEFDRATQDRFFLCVEASDPWYDAARVRWILEQYGAARISEVPP